MNLITITFLSQVMAQKEDEITKKNSWLKIGVNAGVPVGDVSTYTSFAAGVDLSGQFMASKNFGIGVASGYTHFFPKSGFNSFGTVPLGLLLRYYPQYKGFFAGADVGYTFITTSGSTGGLYVKPQLGYHNYDWNLFAFYNEVFRNSGYINIQTVGIAATYNIRFK